MTAGSVRAGTAGGAEEGREPRNIWGTSRSSPMCSTWPPLLLAWPPLPAAAASQPLALKCCCEWGVAGMPCAAHQLFLAASLSSNGIGCAAASTLVAAAAAGPPPCTPSSRCLQQGLALPGCLQVAHEDQQAGCAVAGCQPAQQLGQLCRVRASTGLRPKGQPVRSTRLPCCFLRLPQPMVLMNHGS